MEGVSYELDLSTASVEAFREHMNEYMQHDRRVGGTGRRKTRGKASAPKNRVQVASTSGSEGPPVAEVHGGPRVGAG